MAIESIKYASPETESKLETKAFPRPGQHASGIVDWLTTIDHKKIGLIDICMVRSTLLDLRLLASP